MSVGPYLPEETKVARRVGGIPRYERMFTDFEPPQGGFFKKPFGRSSKGSKNTKTMAREATRALRQSGDYATLRFPLQRSRFQRALTPEDVAQCFRRSKSGLPWNVLMSCSREMQVGMVVAAIAASPYYRTRVADLLRTGNRESFTDFITGLSEDLHAAYPNASPQQILQLFIDAHADENYPAEPRGGWDAWNSLDWKTQNLPGMPGNTARRAFRTHTKVPYRGDVTAVYGNRSYVPLRRSRSSSPSLGQGRLGFGEEKQGPPRGGFSGRRTGSSTRTGASTRSLAGGGRGQGGQGAWPAAAGGETPSLPGYSSKTVPTILEEPFDLR